MKKASKKPIEVWAVFGSATGRFLRAYHTEWSRKSIQEDWDDGFPVKKMHLVEIKKTKRGKAK